MDNIIKIILILAICFIVLFLLKKFIFKIFILICIFFAALFKDELAEKFGQLLDNHGKKISSSIIIYFIFDILEYFLLFSITTISVYKIIFTLSYILFENQSLATYITVTSTLIITCYTSKHYGLIYRLLKKKSKDNADEISEHDEEYTYTLDTFKTLSNVFNKQEKFKNIFSETNLKLIAYVLAFLITFLAKAEFFYGAPIINNNIWIELSKVALESSVTFIAFDRIVGHIKKAKKT